MSVVQLSDHPSYNDTRIVITQIVRLGNAIKRDVSRIIALGMHPPSKNAELHIRHSKSRILKRLETVANIRYKKKYIQNTGDQDAESGVYIVENEKQWDEILHGALYKIYKHSDTPEFRQSFQSLMQVDQNDMSRTGIHFLQAYMRIVARIPEDQILLPFKP